MKASSKRRPSDFVNVELGPERLARMWRVIEAHEQAAPKRSRRAAWAVASTAAVAAGLALWLHFHAHVEAKAELASAGQVIETEARRSSLGLPDGSSMVVSELGRLSVVKATPSEVALHLDRGVVECEVVHDPARPFSVEAAGVTVHVTGTHFAVEVDAERVSVRVQRGSVEVTNASGALVAKMTPGQVWSAPVDAAPAAPSPSASAALAPDASSAAPAASSSPPPTLGVALALDADALLARANAARIAGHTGLAAADYDRFRTRFPQDTRAGLAAFELGRIRLDTLHDPAGALGALSFALAHNRGGFATEDAQALRIDAFARLGDAAGCVRARDAFVAAHPVSAHLARVQRACPQE